MPQSYITNGNIISELEAALKEKQYHHNALWEEEKHYTWLVSIFFSLIALIFTNNTISGDIKVAFIFLGSSTGYFFSIVAFRVIRKEGVYFHDKNSKYVAIYKKKFGDDSMTDVRQTANLKKRDLIRYFLRNDLGVRDMFQLIFLCFMAIFLLISISSLAIIIAYAFYSIK